LKLHTMLAQRRTLRRNGIMQHHSTLFQKKKNGNIYCIRLLMELTGVQHALSTNAHTLHGSARGRMLHWMIKNAKQPPVAANVSLAILIKEMCCALNKLPVRKTMVCQRQLSC